MTSMQHVIRCFNDAGTSSAVPPCSEIFVISSTAKRNGNITKAAEDKSITAEQSRSVVIAPGHIEPCDSWIFVNTFPCVRLPNRAYELMPINAPTIIDMMYANIEI